MTTSLVTTQAEAAKIKVFDEKNSVISISLRGKIRVGDENKLKEILREHGLRRKYALYLNSDGGQLQPASKIGYIVRHLGIITVIDKNKSCLSACSLIFIAGWDEANYVPHRIKHPSGKLGVHHPHEKLKHGRKRKSPKKTMVFMKDYFDRMHAGDPLYKKMARTHYRKMSYVKNKTLRRLPGYHIGKRPHKWPLKKLPEPRTYSKNSPLAVTTRLESSDKRFAHLVHHPGCDKECKEIWKKSETERASGRIIQPSKPALFVGGPSNFKGPRYNEEFWRDTNR